MPERSDRREDNEGREYQDLDDFREHVLKKYHEGEQVESLSDAQQESEIESGRETASESQDEQAGLPGPQESPGVGIVKSASHEREEGNEVVGDRDAGASIDPRMREDQDTERGGSPSLEVAINVVREPDVTFKPELTSPDLAEPEEKQAEDPQNPLPGPAETSEPGEHRTQRDETHRQTIELSHEPKPDQDSDVERSFSEDMGGYSQNENQLTVNQQEAPLAPDAEPKVQIEDLRHSPAGSEVGTEPEADETRVLEAVDYGKGAVVRVPKTDLERLGYDSENAEEKPIVELQLKEPQSEDNEPKTVFARYVESDRRAEAYVDDIGGAKGSRYELVEASRYDDGKFVRDFERGKCEHLDNIGLEHAEERMFLNVDNRRVELENYRLSTSGSHVILRGELYGEGRCKIEFDGRRASVMFARDYPVEEMRMEGDDLVVRYAQSRSEKHESRLYLDHLQEPERPSLNQFGKHAILEHVEMFDHPGRVEGTYQFAIDKTAQSEIARLLAEAGERRSNEYGKMKAEISERLVPSVLELTGWERVMWHPFSEIRIEGAGGHGTDWLLRTPDGKLALVEIKWWADAESATDRGTPQIAGDFSDHPEYGGEKIVGAYVAIVHWDVSDSPMKVYVKRVLPGVRLQ
jgi:hypothetical protein